MKNVSLSIDDWIIIFTYLAMFSYEELDLKIKELQVYYGEQLGIILEQVKYIVNFDYLLDRLKCLKEEYNVDDMNFIWRDSQEKVVIDTFCSKVNYRAVVVPNSEIVEPFRRCDFKTNGIVEHKLLNDEPFMVEEGDLLANQFKRTLFIYDFNLHRVSLPPKEGLNSFSIKNFQDMMFRQLIEDLCFLDTEVNVILGEPNQLYNKDENVTWNADGYVSWIKNLYPIQEANYLVRVKLEEDKIKKIDLLVMEDYLKQIYEESSSDVKSLIDKLMCTIENRVWGL